MSNDKQWTPAEFAAQFGALTEFMQAVTGGKVCRLAIKLPSDIDKHKVIFLGLLDVIFAEAAQRGRSVVWLAPDGNSETRAEVRMHEFRFIMPRPEIGMWYHLAPIPENNFHSPSLDKLWVIGDLDWSDKPSAGDHGEAVVEAVRRVLSIGSCPVLLVHQEGKLPIVPFPPQFGTGSSKCFIATAVYGESAPEVDQLRLFRETYMRSNMLGRTLVTLYERISPMVAERIRSHRWLRAIVRGAAIKPLSWVAGWTLVYFSALKRQDRSSSSNGSSSVEPSQS